MSNHKVVRRYKKKVPKENLDINDPDTHIEVKFDDGLTIKHLFTFIKDLDAFRKIKNIYIVFTKDSISFHNVLMNSEKEYEPLIIYFKIKQYLLTQHIFKSKNESYVMGFDLQDICTTIGLCKKGDFFMIEKKPGDYGITTRNSPDDNSLMIQISLNKYIPFVKPFYNSKRNEPICVVTGEKFSSLCHNFKKSFEEIINIEIYEKGLLFASTVKESKTKKVLAGRIRRIGLIEPQKLLASCYTYKLNIIKLQKLKNCCPNGNLLIYFERDDRGIVKPIKIIYSVGYIGEITGYIGITEY